LERRSLNGGERGEKRRKRSSSYACWKRYLASAPWQAKKEGKRGGKGKKSGGPNSIALAGPSGVAGKAYGGGGGRGKKKGREEGVAPPPFRAAREEKGGEWKVTLSLALRSNRKEKGKQDGAVVGWRLVGNGCVWFKRKRKKARAPLHPHSLTWRLRLKASKETRIFWGGRERGVEGRGEIVVSTYRDEHT